MLTPLRCLRLRRALRARRVGMTDPVIRAMGSGFISRSLNLYPAFPLEPSGPHVLAVLPMSPCPRAHLLPRGSAALCVPNR